MSDNVKSPITYTLKGGKGYEEPWAVFNGTAEEIKRNAVEFFGIDASVAEGLYPAAVMYLIEKSFAGDRVAVGTLGGTPLNQKAEKESSSAWSSSNEPVGWGAVDGAAASEGKSEEPSRVDAMLAQVEAVTSVDDLKKLWSKNKELFNDERLMDAYKAKGRSLKG